MIDANGHIIHRGDIVCFRIDDTIGLCDVADFYGNQVIPERGTIFLHFGGTLELSKTDLKSYDSIKNDGYFYKGLPIQVVIVAEDADEIYVTGNELELLNAYKNFGI